MVQNVLVFDFNEPHFTILVINRHSTGYVCINRFTIIRCWHKFLIRLSLRPIVEMVEKNINLKWSSRYIEIERSHE